MICPNCGADAGLGRCYSCGFDARQKSKERTDDVQRQLTEKEVQAAIVTYLDAVGFHVYDLSQPRNTMQTPGLADLYVVGHGRCAWLECKTEKGKQSEAQELFGARVRANGGLYHVVRSVDDVQEWFQGRDEAA